MKKEVLIIGIVGILILVVAISGCTSTSTNKYDDKYLSFNYPSGWNVTMSNSSSVGETIEGRNPDSSTPKLYFMIKINPVEAGSSSSDYPASLDDWVTGSYEQLGTPDNKGNTTIDGNKAVYMEYLESTSGLPSKIYYIVKGNMTYSWYFYTDNIMDSEIDSIINSTKLK